MKASQQESNIYQTAHISDVLKCTISTYHEEIELHRSYIILSGHMILNEKSEILTYVHIRKSEYVLQLIL